MSDLDNLGGNGSLIHGNPEDKGIGKYGDVPALLEENRKIQESLRILVDTGKLEAAHAFINEVKKRVKRGELKKETLRNLVSMVDKLTPQQGEAKRDYEPTVGELVLKLYAQRKKFDTIEAETVK